MEFNYRGLSVYYEAIGSGTPILMLHGFSPDHTLMSGCMEPLFGGGEPYKRLYLDLPGMGRSQSADWLSSSDSMLEFVIEFARRVIPEGNFLIASESYGCYLARGILLNMADRVDGLLMICPMILADRSKRRLPCHTVLVRDEKLLSGLSPDDAKEADESLVVQNGRILERFEKETMSGIRLANAEFLGKLRARYAFSFDVDGQMEEYAKPALILLGRQDSVVGYEDAWGILSKFPRATFAVLDRAGHNLQIEQEGLFNSLAREWLNRVEEMQSARR